LIITSAICQIVPHSFKLRHHSATHSWRNLKECGKLQLKFKMAETMIKLTNYDTSCYCQKITVKYDHDLQYQSKAALFLIRQRFQL